MPPPQIPKLRVPLEVVGGKFAAVEQDSPEEVAACVYALIATPRDSRLEEPDYGVEDPTFGQLPVELDEWLEQIDIWEPRAEVETAQEIENMLAKITVEVRPR